MARHPFGKRPKRSDRGLPNMSRYSFPYGIRFREDTRVEVFPAVELAVHGKKGKGIAAVFHIDSGATTSALPTIDADALGINLLEGKRTIVRGVSDKGLIGYRHTVTIAFRNTKLKVPVIFAPLSSFPRILGREGVFDRFGIIFDEARQRTGFLDARKERKAIDSLFNAQSQQT